MAQKATVKFGGKHEQDVPSLLRDLGGLCLASVESSILTNTLSWDLDQMDYLFAEWDLQDLLKLAVNDPADYEQVELGQYYVSFHLEKMRG